MRETIDEKAPLGLGKSEEVKYWRITWSDETPADELEDDINGAYTSFEAAIAEVESGGLRLYLKAVTLDPLLEHLRIARSENSKWLEIIDESLQTIERIAV